MSQKLHCNGQFPLTLTWPSWIWQPGDLDDPLHLFGFYDLCDLYHIHHDYHDFYELIDYGFRPHYLPFVIIELLFYNARGLLFSILSKVHTEGMQFPKDILFQWNQLNTNAPPLPCQKGNPLTACREWDSLRFLDTSSFRSIAFWWIIRIKQEYIVDLVKPSAFVIILNILA